MKKQILLLCLLVASSVVSSVIMTLPQASAHSSVETGAGECVLMPNSYHGDPKYNSSNGLSEHAIAASGDNGPTWGSCQGNEINPFPQAD